MLNRQCNSCRNCEGGMSMQIRNLIKKLQQLDFSIVEVNLYLDAYPHCKKALAYYSKLTSERAAVAKLLAENGYPTSPLQNEGGSWDWVKGPWPWEYDANA